MMLVKNTLILFMAIDMNDKINTKDMVDVITSVLEQYNLMHDLNLFQTEGLCITLQAAIDRFLEETK